MQLLSEDERVRDDEEGITSSFEAVLSRYVEFDLNYTIYSLIRIKIPPVNTARASPETMYLNLDPLVSS